MSSSGVVCRVEDWLWPVVISLNTIISGSDRRPAVSSNRLLTNYATQLTSLCYPMDTRGLHRAAVKWPSKQNQLSAREVRGGGATPLWLSPPNPAAGWLLRSNHQPSTWPKCNVMNTSTCRRYAVYWQAACSQKWLTMGQPPRPLGQRPPPLLCPPALPPPRPGKAAGTTPSADRSLSSL